MHVEVNAFELELNSKSIFLQFFKHKMSKYFFKLKLSNLINKVNLLFYCFTTVLSYQSTLCDWF